ncbi:MAG: HDIG domain-containing protein, partial [Peptococcaceae bacterium]|nr:HDIG domain-containing protein [Peptococcaceae bacterium]
MKFFESIKEKLKRRLSLIDVRWWRALAVAAYFLLFTCIIASSLFTSRLNLKLGEPSPQLITAPWAMEIEDEEKYLKDQKEAEENTQPVYRPNEMVANDLIKDLGEAFTFLREAVISYQDVNVRVDRLREHHLFEELPDSVLASLVESRSADINNAEQTAIVTIIGNVRNVDTGARTEADIPVLIDRLRAEINQSSLSSENKSFLLNFSEKEINQPTLQIDREVTEKLAQANREAVSKTVVYYKANQKIIGPGEIVDDLTLRVLEKYGIMGSSSSWRTAGGLSLIILVGMAAIIVYAYQYKRGIYQSTQKMILIGLLMLLALFIGKGLASLNLGEQMNSLTGFLIPVAWATASIAILVDEDIAFLVAFILAVFSGLLVDPMLTNAIGLQVGIVALFGGVTGVHAVSQLSQRSDLASAGLFVSGMNVITISGIALVIGMPLTTWAVALLLGVINGVASSVLNIGTLHWLESGFHITSAVRLLELSNPNHVLLKKLLIEAPGTYHHSILVGNLAEAAAESIQADAVLVRVGALYHDIGKLKRPYFFIENQFSSDNPHDKIAPTLSSLIIISHVKDGLEMAKEYSLPAPIQDIIRQHHGDSLVNFFYYKAKEENEDIPEEAFVYEGPRPQSKEAALVFLADSVEAAVRSMKQPTPGRIEGLVRKLIKDKLNDGQLDQCDLTFRDLDRIAIAFVRVLSGIFHSRVEYPELPGQRQRAFLPENAATIEAEQEEAEEAAEETGDEAAENGETETLIQDEELEKNEEQGEDPAAEPLKRE